MAFNTPKTHLGIKALDMFVLLAVMHYVAFRFLQNSLFPFVYTNTYKYITMLFLIVFGGCRFVIISFMELKACKQKGWYIAKRLFVFCLSIPFFYVAWRYDYKYLVFLPVVALCTYKMDPQKVLHWFSWTVALLLSATVLCCLAGSVQNLTHVRNGHVVGSFGIINTTDFASYFTFLILFIWCAQKNHQWITSLLYSLFTALLTYLVFYYTNSKTSIYCGAISIAIICWDCIDESIQKKQYIRQRINRLTIYVFPISIAITIVLLIGYAKQYNWAITIDQLFTARLKRTLESYYNYGAHPFGTLITTMHGNGRTVINSWSNTKNAYLDIGYAMLILKHGWILGVIIIGSFVWIACRALKGGQKRIALSMIVIAFHAFSEARFLDINYNIFLAMPFCAFIPLEKDEKNKKSSESLKRIIKIDWISIVTAVILSIGIVLIAPKTISWLRTIMFINGWLFGIASWHALLICSVLIVVLIGFWKGICFFCKNRSIMSVIFLTAITVIIVAGSIVGNITIQKGISERKEQLLSEETIIKTIQEVAKKPVYAAEASELYQRAYGGFDEHVFSTEEMYNSQGTIITAGSVEAIGITYMGGKYTAISPWSGVYSYDSAVIEELTEAGYEWKDYYTGERKCILVDLAAQNGLNIDSKGRLILNGSKHSVSENQMWDQHGGTYEVRYSITLPYNYTFSEASKNICRLQIVGETGDITIFEKQVTLGDFDSERKCSITISYYINSTPRVTYLITAEDGVELLVDEIAWRRVT